MESSGFAAEAISAYADLNAVRAGITRDPKDYRFCGYAEAVAGQIKAREGIMSLYRTLSWKDAHARYRLTLFGIGAEARDGKASIPYADFRRVMQEKGELDWSEMIHCRIRHFVHGGIIGSRAFVQEQLAVYERRTRTRPRTRPRPLQVPGDEHALCVMRNVRFDRAA
jgi:hypothetical protein